MPMIFAFPAQAAAVPLHPLKRPEHRIADGSPPHRLPATEHGGVTTGVHTNAAPIAAAAADTTFAAAELETFLLPAFRHWIFGHLAMAEQPGALGSRWRALHWSRAESRLAAHFCDDQAALTLSAIGRLTQALVAGARRRLDVAPPCVSLPTQDERCILGVIGALLWDAGPAERAARARWLVAEPAIPALLAAAAALATALAGENRDGDATACGHGA